MDLDAKAVRQALPKQPTKFSSILANLSSSAAFRKVLAVTKHFLPMHGSLS